MTNWRPDGWNVNTILNKNKFNLRLNAEGFIELGADAMLDALYDMAKKSPTGTFTIDSHEQHVYSDDTEEGLLSYCRVVYSPWVFYGDKIRPCESYYQNMWQTHKASKPVESGYFCPECGRQISNRSESHLCRFNG